MFRCESEIAFSGERLATVARADCNRFSSVLSYSLGIVIDTSKVQDRFPEALFGGMCEPSEWPEDLQKCREFPPVSRCQK